uniref:Ig-like domain-containing protein n=1 Tax=Callorhinchus milii TaxID=7868 RepID=A0A4W3GCF5_CALMI
MHKPTTAICFIYGFRPDSLSVEWLKDWQPIHSGVVTSPSVENNGTFSTSSRLTVTAREWKSDSVYTCKVTHQPSHTITGSQFPCKCPLVGVSFLPPSPKQVLMEPIVTLTCVVANAPHDVNVTWTKEQTHLQSGYGKPSATGPQEVISKLNISTQDWTDGKVYFCIVSHDDIPTPIRKKIFTEPGEQPMYLLLPSAEELSAQQSLTLSCLVKNFAPKEIFVEWTVNDQSIHANKYKNTEVMADSADGDYSMYSMLSISAGDWDRGYSYSCVVGHETFPLKTLTRAVNKSSDHTDDLCFQQDEHDNLWPTASTFIILFFLSIFYSATVTLFKAHLLILWIFQYIVNT